MLEFNEVGVLDRNAEELGVPTSELMENAGRGLADFIIKNLISGKKFEGGRPEISILCGPGNNGGDGFVAARYLADHAVLKIILTASPGMIRTALAKQNFDKIDSAVPVHAEPSADELKELLEKTDIIIDSMLGAGLSGELRKPYTEYIQVIKDTEAVIVATDTPTGLGTSTYLKPDHTVTFHDTKTGMTNENSGNIVTIPIGIPEDAERFIGPGELVAYYPHPSKSSHKGENGRLLIVGGGPYTGAPALAGLAALRTGVDLVYIATPMECKNAVSSYSPNFIVSGLEGSEGEFIVPDDIYKILELCTRSDACVLGPGLGRDVQTLTFVQDLLQRCPIPVILDADGLAALESSRFGPGAADKDTNKPKSGWLITPHFNEFKRIMEQILNISSIEPVVDASQSPEISTFCKNLSWALGAVVVLKGSVDIVCESDLIKYNRTGNPGMTVGGTGDVLTGIIGALASKGLDLYNCGRLGVFINGSAGDLAWKDMGPGMTATDIVEYIPKVLTKFITF